MNALLEQALQHAQVWRGDQLARSEQPGLATGFAALDAVLPALGWSVGSLTEVLCANQGIGELSLLAPSIAALTQRNEGVVLINPPYWVYAPAWAQCGINLAHCLVVRPDTANDVMWVAEQSLRSGACGLVLVWPEHPRYRPDHRALRRLQTAADTGATACIVFRGMAALKDASPAPLRLTLQAHQSQLSVHIVKRRGPPLDAPILLNVRPSYWEPRQTKGEDKSLTVSPRHLSTVNPQTASLSSAPSLSCLRHISQ